MQKKVITSIFVIVVLIIIILIIRNVSKRKGNNSISYIEEKREVSNIIKDEETGEYVIYDKETGDEIARSIFPSELHIYEVNPDYKVWSPILENEELRENTEE